MAKAKTSHTSDHHVRFDTAVDEHGKDNEITFFKTSEKQIEVHLGFLQLNHKYEISLLVPKKMFNIGNSNSKCLTHEEPTVPNLHCNSKSISEDGDNLKFEIIYIPNKDKVVDQSLDFKVNGMDDVYSLVMVSRVLGKGKGTPMLKNGIHCVGEVATDDESEVSDWYGFE